MKIILYRLWRSLSQPRKSFRTKIKGGGECSICLVLMVQLATLCPCQKNVGFYDERVERGRKKKRHSLMLMLSGNDEISCRQNH